MRTVEGTPEGRHSLGKDIKFETNMTCAGDTEGLAGADVRVEGIIRDEAEVGGRREMGSGTFSTLFFFFFLPRPCSQDLSSPTRD